jgi:polar amino acid transport system ATP-binding protein
MIEARDLHKQYGALQILRGVTFSVAEGEVALVIGPSGCGKSTFLRCLNGLETFDSGQVRVGEHELSPGNRDRAKQASLRAVRQQLGMVFQQFNLFPHLTVLANVIEAPVQVLGLGRDEAVDRGRAGRQAECAAR